MHKRITFILCAVFAGMALYSTAHAKMPPKIGQALSSAYPPAVHHKALDSAYYPIEIGKLRGYCVVMRGGVPAEQARYYISWDDYDYRGVEIIFNTGEEEIKTRYGRPYTYLQPGDVMAVVDMKKFGKTIYLKLISADIYSAPGMESEKRHSRVTVMLGFKFPKDVISNDDAMFVLQKMGEWLKPFSNADEAKAFAASIKPAGASAKTIVDPREQKIKTLEDKIDAAKRQMEEAEQEVQKLKSR